MPSPSPCSELPFPSQLLQIYCLAWCLVLWVYPFGLYDSASSLLFLFCGKINFQKHLDYFFPFFKTFCCVAPYSDVNQVPLLFILLHWVWISPWEAKGLSPPLGQSIAGIMPFWVLEAPSPEAVLPSIHRLWAVTAGCFSHSFMLRLILISNRAYYSCHSRNTVGFCPCTAWCP